MMMYNITTGYGGIPRRKNQEIAIFVSSIYRLQELSIPYVFTNQHAYAAGSDFYSDIASLRKIDWALLNSRNFTTDDSDPGKQLRYQAEALAYQHVPLDALLGVGCFNEDVKLQLDREISESDAQIVVKVKPKWYF